jgi:hypothetical protein
LVLRPGGTAYPFDTPKGIWSEPSSAHAAAPPGESLPLIPLRGMLAERSPPAGCERCDDRRRPDTDLDDDGVLATTIGNTQDPPAVVEDTPGGMSKGSHVLELVRLMQTSVGRAARVALGVVLIAVGLILGGGWLALAVVGSVPIIAGSGRSVPARSALPRSDPWRQQVMSDANARRGNSGLPGGGTRH